MFDGRCAVVVVASLALLLPPVPPAAATQEFYCDDSTYADNSTFQANLNLLGAALPANASASASPAGYATGAVGAAPDQVNGMALCRGDTNASSCSSCVTAAFRDAQQRCPLNKGATVYKDACTLRFAGIRFLDFLREDQWLVSELV
jgi:hypothetical protein